MLFVPLSYLLISQACAITIVAQRLMMIMTFLPIVSNIILQLKPGKPAGLDSLTAEHLVHSHPSLSGILSKLFNLMLRYGYLPNDFGQSYTVPLYKASDCHTKSASC